MLRKADMPTPKLTNEIITAAILGFESQKTKIDAQIAELRAMLPGGSTQTAATPEPTKRKRRKMSAAGRKAISEATKKRWAAKKTAAGIVGGSHRRQIEIHRLTCTNML